MVNRIIGDRFKLENKINDDGSLWRATDINDNSPILLRIHLLNKRSTRNWIRLESTLEEIAKMNCEHLVKVIEWGDCVEGKYIALEWAEGQPLSQCKLDLSKSLSTLLCVANAYKQLIDHDIVHISITADNIIVTGDKVKVFGFDSLLSERTKLKQIKKTRLMKTLNWIAPELLSGKKRSALSCLYSFGLLSYYTLTGELPFQSRNPNNLVWDIKNNLPNPISVLNPSIPISVDNMVKRLLHKEPSARFQSFSQVISSLEKGIVECGSSSSMSIRTGMMLHRGRLIGKHQQLSAIQGVVSNPDKSIVVIDGEMGTGKTRFLHDVMSIARDLDIVSIFISCESSLKDSPWAQFASLISEVIEDFGIGFIGRSEHKRVFASVCPQLRTRALMDKSKVITDPNQISEHLEKAFPWLLSQITKDNKLLIIVDDAHHCNDESSNLMINAFKKSSETDLVLIFSTDSSSTKHFISRYLKDVSHKRMSLKPFTPKQTQDMVATVLGSADIPLHIIDELHYKTKGNPLDILQIIAGLVSSGKTFNASMRLDVGDMPTNRDDIAKLRLNSLDDKTFDILCEASVLGDSFREDVLIDISSHPRQVVEDVLDVATMSMLISMNKTTSGYQHFFVFPELRNHLLNRLNSSQKKYLHDRIAKTLIKRYGDDIDCHFDELLVHIIDGSEKLSSVEYLIRASKIALKNYKLKKAIDLGKQAKEFAIKTGNARLIIDSSVQYSTLLVLMGDKHTASESIRGTYSALSKAGLDMSNESKMLIEMATIESQAGEIYEAENLIRKVYRKLGKSLNKVQIARCHLIESGNLFHIDKQASFNHIKKSVEIALQVDNPEMVGMALIDMMQIELSLGKYNSAKRTRMMYADKFTDRCSVMNQLNYLTACVMKHINMGNFAEAYRILSDLWSKAIKLGSIKYRAIGSYLRSTLLQYTGNTTASLELSKRSLELARSIELKTYIGKNLVNMGRIFLKQGNEVDLNKILEECRISDSVVKERYKTPGYDVLSAWVLVLGERYTSAIDKANYIIRNEQVYSIQDRYEASLIITEINLRQFNFQAVQKNIEQIRNDFPELLTSPVNECDLYLLEGEMGIASLANNQKKGSSLRRKTFFPKFGISSKNAQAIATETIEKAYVIALSSGLELQSALATLSRARLQFALYEIESSEEYLIKTNTLVGISEMLAENLQNQGLKKRIDEFINYKESYISKEKESH